MNRDLRDKLIITSHIFQMVCKSFESESVNVVTDNMARSVNTNMQSLKGSIKLCSRHIVHNDKFSVYDLESIYDIL